MSAMAYCASLDLEGGRVALAYGDELVAFTDYTRWNPALDPVFSDSAIDLPYWGRRSWRTTPPARGTSARQWKHLLHRGDRLVLRALRALSSTADGRRRLSLNPFERLGVRPLEQRGADRAVHLNGLQIGQGHTEGLQNRDPQVVVGAPGEVQILAALEAEVLATEEGERHRIVVCVVSATSVRYGIAMLSNERATGRDRTDLGGLQFEERRHAGAVPNLDVDQELASVFDCTLLAPCFRCDGSPGGASR